MSGLWREQFRSSSDGRAVIIAVSVTVLVLWWALEVFTSSHQTPVYERASWIAVRGEIISEGGSADRLIAVLYEDEYLIEGVKPGLGTTDMIVKMSCWPDGRDIRLILHVDPDSADGNSPYRVQEITVRSEN